jgi:hypothetical protein
MIEKKELFEAYEKVIAELALLENKYPSSQLDKKQIKVLNQKKQALRNSVLASGAEEIVGSFSVKNKQLVQAEEGFNNFPQADGNYAVIQIK